MANGDWHLKVLLGLVLVKERGIMVLIYSLLRRDHRPEEDVKAIVEFTQVNGPALSGHGGPWPNSENRPRTRKSSRRSP